MKKAIILCFLLALSGCAARPPVQYTGVNGSTGFNNISQQQAEAECEYQANNALNATLDRTRGGIFSAAGAYSDTMRGCMKSKGFN